MKLFLLLIAALLTVTKATVVGHISKKRLTSAADTLFFNFCLFLLTGIYTLILYFFSPSALSLTTIILAVTFGILSVVFQQFYSNAFKEGAVSLTVLISSFSLVIPTLMGAVIYSDHLSAIRLIGIAVLFVSLWLCIAKKSSDKVTYSLRWLIFALICFFSNGALQFTQKIHQNTDFSDERNGFIFIAYFTAAVISLILYITQRVKGQEFTLQMRFDTAIAVVVSAVILGSAQRLLLLLAGLIESTVLYPTYNCLTTILSALAGIVIFKERLSRKQLLGIFLGTVSIVMISM